MNTITPAFPGDYGTYADHAPTTGTYQAAHRQQRRDAKAGRVRKPSRRGVLLEKAARAVSVVAVSFTVGAVLTSLLTAGRVIL